jgi:hypothetical protein
MSKEAGVFCNAAGTDSLFAVIVRKNVGNNPPTPAGIKLLSSLVSCQANSCRIDQQAFLVVLGGYGEAANIHSVAAKPSGKFAEIAGAAQRLCVGSPIFFVYSLKPLWSTQKSIGNEKKYFCDAQKLSGNSPRMSV